MDNEYMIRLSFVAKDCVGKSFDVTPETFDGMSF